MGYGNKYDFTKERGQDTPAPNAYASPSDFDEKEPFSASYTFGISRDLCEKRYIEGNVKPDPAVPGPGSYSIRKAAGSLSPKFSFRQRTPYDQPFKVDSNPGPGAYSPVAGISPKGSYFLSKYRGSGASVFSPASLERFENKGKRSGGIPGPGAYRPKFEMAANGEYFVSKYKASLCRTFSKSPKGSSPVRQSLHVPGPGSYRQPSEFGYYESKKASSMRGSASLPSLKPVEGGKPE